MAPPSLSTKFTPETLEFIKKAGRQKNPQWLDKNHADYERLLKNPIQNLASVLKKELQALAPAYHFPQKGIGRIRRNRPGAGPFKDWITYSASRPSESRFENNPNLFFLINPNDETNDQVLVAGGLYMPSSRQIKLIRSAIAVDARPFEQLFASQSFSRQFKGGFSNEKQSTRVPRGYPADHPKIEWIRLQAFFVWRKYTLKKFSSKDFPRLVVKDWAQIIRLNSLLEQAIQGSWQREPINHSKKTSKEGPILERLSEVETTHRNFDF